jgi:peptidoglycan/LPS O-acetylase OafA/YrhL
MILYFCWKAVGESAVLIPLEFAVTLVVASASYFLLERWSKRLRPAAVGRDQMISETKVAGIPGVNLDALY